MLTPQLCYSVLAYLRRARSNYLGLRCRNHFGEPLVTCSSTPWSTRNAAAPSPRTTDDLWRHQYRHQDDLLRPRGDLHHPIMYLLRPLILGNLLTGRRNLSRLIPHRQARFRRQLGRGTLHCTVRCHFLLSLLIADEHERGRTATR